MKILKYSMEKMNLEVIPLEDLWSLHEQITKVLSARIIAQKKELEHRLEQLNLSNPERRSTGETRRPVDVSRVRSKRKYPQVLPKFQNPSAPGETWSGRGKQPRWLVAALRAGGKMEDFAILGDKQTGAMPATR